MPNRQLLVDDIRIRAIAKTGIEPKHMNIKKSNNRAESAKVSMVQNVYFEASEMSTNVYLYDDLFTGDVVRGPAIIIDKNW
jgi:N-methylhydantoinase A/oxoprolinase/acetone carboxylase beta subunit